MELSRRFLKFLIIGSFSLLMLVSTSMEGVFYRLVVYRKIVQNNGKKTYQYRFCLHDRHCDFVDGRVRKRQQHDLVDALLPIANQSLILVEDMDHYPNAKNNPQVYLGLQSWIASLHSIELAWVKNAILWKRANPNHPLPLEIQSNGGSLQGLTEYCKARRIHCRNVEYRHAATVNGQHYRPTCKQMLSTLERCWNNVRNHNALNNYFPNSIYDMNEMVLREQGLHGGYSNCACPKDSNQVISLDTALNRLMDIRVMDSLLDYEQQNIPYLVIALGGAHHERLESQHEFWTKMDYQKIAEIGDFTNTDIDQLQKALNVRQLLAPHLPQRQPVLNPVNNKPQQKKPVIAKPVIRPPIKAKPALMKPVVVAARQRIAIRAPQRVAKPNARQVQNARRIVPPARPVVKPQPRIVRQMAKPVTKPPVQHVIAPARRVQQVRRVQVQPHRVAQVAPRRTNNWAALRSRLRK